MKMNFNWDKVDGLAKALGGRVDLIERLVNIDGLTQEMIDLIANSDFRKDFVHLYGFHIDSNESDPMEAVTYLEDAVGMKPAFMDYDAGEFNYGSWEDAFFMPRPCMLKYDGTVDYYLDPNDYSKKADGTDSDSVNFVYEGNAMMEWGRDGKKIWYKVVPDEDDNTSASIYFSDYKLDDEFHAWSFINSNGDLVDHFYTPIYNGTIDLNNKLRSISGKPVLYLCQDKTAAEEIEAAELNNPGEDKLWYTETFADCTLINLLLVLIGKCLNTQLVFGNGACKTRESGTYTAADMIGTGTLDDKGLFFGFSDTIHAVKVFGMENYWGNQARRFAGLMSINRAVKYKMTYGTEDGSTSESYNTTGADYLDSVVTFNADSYGYISKHKFTENGGMFMNSFTGSNTSYYADYGIVFAGTTYACRGGSCDSALNAGAFYCVLAYAASNAFWYIGAAPSCKPLS